MPMLSVSSLPNDLILSCLARVSSLYYPTLSLVSKRFQSLITSPELYKARSLLGRTESRLYVCIGYSADPNPRWFTLCRKPSQSLTKKKLKSNEYVLAKVPILDFPHVNHTGKGLVEIGSSIYNIGGSKSSNSVSILDCTCDTWREAPSFRVKLWRPTACVINRKIYVAGNYYSDSGSIKNSIEVLDTETQIWDPLPIPVRKTKCDFSTKSVCIDGKFHLECDRKVFAYNSKERRWDLAGGMFQYLGSYCEIDNVFYSVSQNSFTWYDSAVSVWRDVKGLVGLPEFPRNDRVRLANYGGNMAVFWEEKVSRRERMIWCAVILLKKRKNGEIRGIVEWYGHVLTVLRKCDVIKALAATV